MQTGFLLGGLAAIFLLAGCGQKPAQTGASSPPTEVPGTSAVATPAPTPPPSPAPATVNVASPVMQPILAVWQEGNPARAVNLFAEADWNGRPTFPPGMALSLTEAQFAALPSADQQLKFGEISAQLDLVKHLASAVAQAGRDAAAKGDPEQARKLFASLKQCGAALETPEHLKLLRTVGLTMKNMADRELAKMGH